MLALIFSCLQIGILRYAGSTEFASGQWGGIEFERAEGKNDGSLGGVRYFKCKPDHGELYTMIL